MTDLQGAREALCWYRDCDILRWLLIAGSFGLTAGPIFAFTLFTSSCCYYDFTPWSLASVVFQSTWILQLSLSYTSRLISEEPC